MSKPPDFGPAFHGAGRCSMYLTWLQSRLADFLCIRDARKRNDLAIIREYEETQLTGRPSIKYHKQVLQWSEKSFGTLIKEFLSEWPAYKSNTRVSHAFKILEIHRNALAHAYMGNSDWFVFKPNAATRKRIKNTGLLSKELARAGPDFSLLYPLHDEGFVVRFYENIKIIDLACFMDVAQLLGVTYVSTLNDPHWPVTEGIDPVTLASRPD